jgi:hypothetical protein
MHCCAKDQPKYGALLLLEREKKARPSAASRSPLPFSLCLVHSSIPSALEARRLNHSLDPVLAQGIRAFLLSPKFHGKSHLLFLSRPDPHKTPPRQPIPPACCWRKPASPEQKSWSTLIFLMTTPSRPRRPRLI